MSVDAVGLCLCFGTAGKMPSSIRCNSVLQKRFTSFLVLEIQVREVLQSIRIIVVVILFDNLLLSDCV